MILLLVVFVQLIFKVLTLGSNMFREFKVKIDSSSNYSRFNCKISINKKLSRLQQPNQYGNGVPNNSYNPYFASGQGIPALMGHDPAIIQSHHSHHHGVNPHTLQAMQQKIPRSDRLEVNETKRTQILTLFDCGSTPN